MSTEVYVVDCKVEINGKIEELTSLHADIVTGFIENLLPHYMFVGIRRANKEVKKLKGSKKLMKEFERLLNSFYKENYKVVDVYAGATGYLWNYRGQYYYYPE